MTSQALPWLIRADGHARDILMDSYGTGDAGQAMHGLAVVMRSAAAAWDAVPADLDGPATDIATGTPFATAAMVATQLETDHVINQAVARPDPRMATISALLDQAAPVIGDQMSSNPDPGIVTQVDAAQVRAVLLHVGYVLAHAAANTTSRQAASLAEADPDLGSRLGLIVTRIRGIEHTLDAHLRRRPHSTSVTPDIRSLDQALDRFVRSAYQLAPSNGAANQVVVADIGRAVTGTTARLAIESAQRGRIPVAEVRDRLLPALQAGVHQWEASRHSWARLLTPTDRPEPQITAAGIHLQRQLHHPDLAAHPAITATMTRALALASELAILNRQALASPDRTAPAATVARLTAEALDQLPAGADHTRIWLSLNRIEGPGSVPIPSVVRENLNRQGHATLNAAVDARSAGHTLVDRTGYHALAALQQDTTGPRHPPREPPRAEHRGATAPRIG